MKIFYADDDPEEIDFFCDALKTIDESIECITAKDGQQALKMLEEIPQPDLIFLDINMPRVNGKECLKHIKSDSRLKTIPVIMYSTGASEQDIRTLYHLGAHRFLRKHFDTAELCQELRMLIAV